MTIDTISANLDTNVALVEETTDGGWKATAYFEDFLFKLFQDIAAVNLDSGVVETITLNGTDFELEQSGGVSPLTADLVTLDGRNLTLTLTDNILSLTQSQGTSPLTVDLGASLSSFAGLGTWRYRTETVPPPASGQLRFNNADPELATLLFLSETNDDGTDVANFLDLLNAGDVIYIQERTNSANFILVQIANNIDFGTYRQFAIAAVVQQGVALTQNTRVAVVITASGGDFQGSMDSRMFVSSDFTDAIFPAQTLGIKAFGGAGGIILIPGVLYDFTDHPGVWGLVTGIATNGRVFLLSATQNTLKVGLGGATRLGAWYQSPVTLSDAVNRYVLRMGFSVMALPNTITQGITFEYQDDQNGGRWQALCEDGVAETSVDTGITVTTLTYYKMEIEINAAGDSVEFFIDNVSVATVTTNIPSGATFGHFVNIHIMKLLGVSSRVSYIDAYYLTQEITR